MICTSQLATNTLERVAPLTHAVGNVLKRVFVIGLSIIIFGRKLVSCGLSTKLNSDCSHFSKTFLQANMLL